MNTIVNMHEAKTNLSKIAALVEQGQVFTLAKAGTPIATINPIEKKKTPRTPGTMKGEIYIAEDFDELPEDFTKYFT